MLVGAEEDLARRKGGCRVRGLAQFILREDDQFLELGFEHDRRASLVRDEQVFAGGGDRAPDGSLDRALAPAAFAGSCIDAGEGAADDRPPVGRPKCISGRLDRPNKAPLVAQRSVW